MRASVEPYGICHLSVLDGATANELKVYVAISSFQGNNKYAFPSLGEIAQRATISKTACSLAITKLVKKGFIYRKRNYGANNNYVCTPNVETIPEIKRQNKEIKKKKSFSYSENHNNYENRNNNDSENHNNYDSENRNVSYSENQNVGYSENRNDINKNIIKEHIKRTWEKREDDNFKTSDQLIEEEFSPPPQDKNYIPDEKLSEIISNWKSEIQGYKPAMLSREKQSIRRALGEGYTLEEIKEFISKLKIIRESKDKKFEIYRNNSFSFSFLMGKEFNGNMLGQLIGIIDSGSLPKDQEPGYSYGIWSEMSEEEKLKAYSDEQWHYRETDKVRVIDHIGLSDDGDVPKGSVFYPYLGIYVDRGGHVYRDIMRVKYLFSVGKGHLFKKFNIKGVENVA